MRTIRTIFAFAGLLLLGGYAFAAAGVFGTPLTVYVSPTGNDAWSGTLSASNAGKTDGPFATLAGARDAIRVLRQGGKLPADGVVVEVQAGEYVLTQPFTLTAQDSGSADAPVVYRARKGGEVRLVGSKTVTNWTPVTDKAVLARLDPAARGHVLQADLRALGITDYGVPTGGWGQWDATHLELFCRDKPMTMARWPKRGIAYIDEVCGKTPHIEHGIAGCEEGVFTCDTDRLACWKDEKDLWLEGYWFWDWAEQRQPVVAIDPEKRQITLGKPDHCFGYRKGQWFYAYNALCELNTPGEWCLDREKGRVYCWPPASGATATAVVSMLPALITCKETSYVTVQGMTLECARGTAITMDGGAHNTIAGCTIRNCGAWAVKISGGTHHSVLGCDIYDTGDGGVIAYGGDRNALTPGGHNIENNHIHHYARWNRVYQPAIRLGGVGNRAAHNLIDNAPHMAIGFDGNDHVIEYNEIHSVCYESNDAGAIYAGRNWTWRGTTIRYNYFHHISGREGRGCVGVYFDDQLSGNNVYGNIFYKVTQAAMIGGGRDCHIENNIFVDCVPAVFLDSRGLGWAASGKDGLRASLAACPYQSAPWKDRYPALVNILNDEPMAPKGNTIARNICVGGQWSNIESTAQPYANITGNLIGVDPHFVDADHADFRLQADSPAWLLGFKRIPVEQIGLYQDKLRASWPVHSEVRGEGK